jgi:glycerol-3-phosphate acyltransferase PlsY
MLNMETIFCAVAYLIGSLPFSYLIVKSATGEDLRAHFSGNAGATNAGRVLKKFMPEEQKTKASLLHKIIFILDVLKGVAAVQLMIYFAGPSEPWPIVAGICAVLGHTLPVFLGFRGGKGVATCLGLIMGLLPMVALITFALWALITFVSRYVSLGSVLAALLLHAVIYFIKGPDYIQSNPLTMGLLGLLSLMLVITHRQNIKRLLKGEESKIGSKKKEAVA